MSDRGKKGEALVTRSFSIIVPTRDRCQILKQLLDSLKKLRGLERIQPEVIIGDNGSKDQTWGMLQETARQFPVPFRTLKVSRPGKCAVINEGIRLAKGDILAFLDDDVVVEPGWLEALESFFRENDNNYLAGQGVIRLQSPNSQDPEILRLVERYRTIPNLEYTSEIKEVRSLNGANMAICRRVFEKAGNFDERLGPGASGTSEDVELALRILRGGMKIGYMRKAIVYHRVDRTRLTEAYFKSIHKHQGQSRAKFKGLSVGRILSDLVRVAAQFAFYSLAGTERKKYRNKGRIYHYLGMLESKFDRRR